MVARTVKRGFALLALPTVDCLIPNSVDDKESDSYISVRGFSNRVSAGLGVTSVKKFKKVSRLQTCLEKMDRWLQPKENGGINAPPKLKKAAGSLLTLVSNKKRQELNPGGKAMSPPKKKLGVLSIMSALSTVVPANMESRPAAKPIPSVVAEAVTIGLSTIASSDSAEIRQLSDSDSEVSVGDVALAEIPQGVDDIVESDEEDGTAVTLGDVAAEIIQYRQRKMDSFTTSQKTGGRMPAVKFQSDPRQYSSALYNKFAKVSRRSARTRAASKCVASLAVLPVTLNRVQYSEGDAKAKTPVTVIRFDRLSALFAVGGANGIVRVYDFDECLSRSQSTLQDPFQVLGDPQTDRSKRGVHPVVSVDTRRAVSDIAWSPDNDDEICVSFSFRS